MRFRSLLRAEVLIPVLAVVMRVIPGPRTIDDAYITFRYAQNLISGIGLVYNPGERVLGTTTPLYAFIMSALGVLTGGEAAPFPLLAVLLNAILDAIACLLLIQLGKRLGFQKAGIGAALIWAIAPYSVTFAIGGMETSLFVMLMLATFYFHSSNRPLPAALMASLSILTRPDALIFVLPLALERLRQLFKRSPTQPTWRELAFFLVPLLIWGGVATYYYGSPVPHSITAKVEAYQLPPEAGIVRLLQHFGTPFLGHLLFGTWWIAVGLLVFLTLYLIGSVGVFRRWSSAWPILIYPIAYCAIFAIVNPLIFRWYLTPPLPIYFFGIFAGVERLTNIRDRKMVFSAFLLGTSILTLNGWTWNPDHGSTRPAPEMAFIKLELIYQNVAEHLGPILEPGDTIAAGDIGALGFYSGARILDTVGLISPRSLPYYPLPSSYYAINYAIAPELILQENPEYLVMLEVYGRNGLLKNPQFLERYQLIQQFPTDIYGSKGMLIFQFNRQP